MLSRKFTKRENRLLLLSVCLLMAVFYYLLAAKPVQAQIGKNRQELMKLEDQLEIERYRAERKEQMLEMLGQENGTKKGELYPYDNLMAEMQELEQILSAAHSYEIQISPVTVSESIVQRETAVSFETGTYGEAYGIIKEIEYGAFRCTVRDIELSAAEGADGERRISGQILVVYYERKVE